MSRPLDLVLFNGYRPAKRLTDAELAAEYWSAAAVVESALRRGSGLVAPLSDERNTLHRFATHPHYDEGEQ